MLKFLVFGIGLLAAGPSWAEDASADLPDQCFNAECLGFYDTPPADAQCTPREHAKVSKIDGLDYPAARSALLASGWKPRSAADELTSNEQWAIDAGFSEVEACAGTGAAPCSFNFTDRDGNNLRIVTEGEGGDADYPPTVVGASFLCRP